MNISLGAAFLFQPDTSPKLHMYVLFGQNASTGKFIAGNLSGSCPERVCVFHPGCHPFVTKVSYVRYQYLLNAAQDTLERYFTAYPHYKLASMTMDQVEQMQAGAHRSTIIKTKFLAHIPNPTLKPKTTSIVVPSPPAVHEPAVVHEPRD